LLARLQDLAAIRRALELQLSQGTLRLIGPRIAAASPVHRAIFAERLTRTRITPRNASMTDTASFARQSRLSRKHEPQDYHRYQSERMMTFHNNRSRKSMVICIYTNKLVVWFRGLVTGSDPAQEYNGFFVRSKSEKQPSRTESLKQHLNKHYVSGLGQTL